MFKKLLFVVLFDMIFAGAFLSCLYHLFGQTDWYTGPDTAVPGFLVFMAAGPFMVFIAYTVLLYFVTLLPALWFSRGKSLKMRLSMRVLAYATWWAFWFGLGLLTHDPLLWNPIAVSGLLSTALSEPLWDYVVSKRAKRRARRGKTAVQDA